MVRIYDSAEQTFDNNGLVVIQPLSCRVTHKLDGDFYLDLTCSTEYLDYIQPSYIVYAPTPQGDQAFRIKTVKRTGRRIEARAWHVMYDLQNYLVFAAIVSNKNCEDALLYAKSRTDTTCPFSLTSDIEATNSYTGSRKDMLTVLQEIAELYEGHIIPDNWSIAVNSSVGVDNQITITYGKNLDELTAEYDFSDVCTKVLPIGKDEITLPSYYLTGPTQYDVPYSRVVTFEQDKDPEDYKVNDVVSWQSYQNALRNDLREKATAYLLEHQYPQVNYSLKGKPEVVSDVGDTIEVKDKRIGVDLLTQVISYEYDCIREDYVSLEFGNFTDNLGTLLDDLKTSIINQTNYTVQNSVSTVNNSLINKTQTLTSTCNTITEAIEDGYAAIIDGILYIGDASPVEDATVVYKWDADGLSLSKNGFSGTYYSVLDSSGYLSVYSGSYLASKLGNATLAFYDGPKTGMYMTKSALNYYKSNNVLATLTAETLKVNDTEIGPYNTGAVKIAGTDMIMGYILDTTKLYFTVKLPRAIPLDYTITIDALSMFIYQTGGGGQWIPDAASNSNYTITVFERGSLWPVNTLTFLVEKTSAYRYEGIVAVQMDNLNFTLAD